MSPLFVSTIRFCSHSNFENLHSCLYVSSIGLGVMFSVTGVSVSDYKGPLVDFSYLKVMAAGTHR